MRKVLARILRIGRLPYLASNVMDNELTRVALDRVRQFFWASICLAMCIYPTVPDIFASAVSYEQQSSDRGGVRFTGRVIDASTAAAIPGARLTVSSIEGINYQIVADGSGRFSSTPVPAGPYQVAVFANDYLPAAFGQIWPKGPSRSLHLSRKTPQGLVLQMWKPASLSGTVTNSSGKPLESAAVELLRVGNGTADSR